MNIKSELKIKFVTRKNTTTREFCLAFLDVLIERHPELAPDYYDWDPKCRRPFTGVEDALSSWAFKTAFKETENGKVVSEIPTIWGNWLRRKGKANQYMVINHTQTNKFGNPIYGLISITAAKDRKIDWLQIFRDLTEIIEPVLARIHIFTNAELSELVSGSSKAMFWAGPAQPEVTDGVTNLAWANFFGDEFAHEVDEARLREHGFAVEPVGNGKLFRVTDNIFDLVDDFPKFSDRRAKLKSLFRPGMFQITDEPALPA